MLKIDLQGSPIEDATVKIWQADNNEFYKHPRIQGQLDPNVGYFGNIRTAVTG